MLKAVALALRRTPELNGFHRDGRFQPGRRACRRRDLAARGGLVAPAIHDVGDKALGTLMRELADLVKRARAGSLRSSEMERSDDHRHQPRRPGRGAGLRRHLPAAGGAGGFGALAERPWVLDGKVQALPVCAPRSPPTTVPRTAIAAPSSWPNCASCCSSRRRWMTTAAKAAAQTSAP